MTEEEEKNPWFCNLSAGDLHFDFFFPIWKKFWIHFVLFDLLFVFPARHFELHTAARTRAGTQGKYRRSSLLQCQETRG